MMRFPIPLLHFDDANDAEFVPNKDLSRLAPAMREAEDKQMERVA
jgi:hypothetical protein